MPDSRSITLKVLKKWQTDIQSDKSNKTIGQLVQAFHAALQRVSGAENDEPVQFKVDGKLFSSLCKLKGFNLQIFTGSSVFNAVIQLCVLELGPAVKRFLGLSPGSKQPPHKCRRFVKIRTLLRTYFSDLLQVCFYYYFLCLFKSIRYT